MNVISSL